MTVVSKRELRHDCKPKAPRAGKNRRDGPTPPRRLLRSRDPPQAPRARLQLRRRRRRARRRARGARADRRARRSRRRGRRCGSARIRTGTFRRRARTPRGASSTATTMRGVRGATRRSSTTWSRSPTRCPICARASSADLGDCDALGRACVLAAAVRLLERGFFRIGSEEYAVENESYGLATMRKEHVTIEDDGLMVFDYPAKSGQRRHQGCVDERWRRDRRGAQAPPRRRRRSCSRTRTGGRWRDVRSEDINEYLKDATGGDFSAKDFRTWNATALAAVALAVSGEAATHQDGAQARDQPRGQGGREVPRQHARGLPRVLHRPARVRRLRRRADHPPRARARRAGGRARRAADPPARARGRRAGPDRRARLLRARSSGWPPSAARAGAASTARP